MQQTKSTNTNKLGHIRVGIIGEHTSGLVCLAFDSLSQGVTLESEVTRCAAERPESIPCLLASCFVPAEEIETFLSILVTNYRVNDSIEFGNYYIHHPGVYALFNTEISLIKTMSLISQSNTVLRSLVNRSIGINLASRFYDHVVKYWYGEELRPTYLNHIPKMTYTAALSALISSKLEEVNITDDLSDYEPDLEVTPIDPQTIRRFDIEDDPRQALMVDFLSEVENYQIIRLHTEPDEEESESFLAQGWRKGTACLDGVDMDIWFIEESYEAANQAVDDYLADCDVRDDDEDGLEYA